MNKIQIIDGGYAIDDRGQVTFVNDLSFAKIKRFYIVENFSLQTIRAFHGHMHEDKFVLPLIGSALIAAVPLTSTTSPSKDVTVERFVLSARKPQIIHIPSGYANGFMSLEPGTKLMFLSTSSLDESKNDDYRFSADYWGNSIWQIENR